MENDIAEWARDILNLDPDSKVSVREKDSNDPRCSPVVTELTIETPGESPYVFHIEQPLADVTEPDVMAAIAFGGH